MTEEQQKMMDKQESELIATAMTYMPEIENYKSSFDSLNRLLGKTTLTGKISSLDTAENLFHYMEKVKDNFSSMQADLIGVLAGENVTKVVNEIRAIAQVTIDILIRNLFERTADVGFLATDDDLRAFLKQDSPSDAEKAIIVERLEEYVKKYSVYDEIILFDPSGKVRVHLDSSNPITHSSDPLIAQTLNTEEEYVETFRYSDLQAANEQSLIYSAPINTANEGGETLGVLCLCFKIQDEMERIFTQLIAGSEQIHIALLSPNSKVITSSHPEQFPTGMAVNETNLLVQIGKREYLSWITDTNGYQGYKGSGWKGAVFFPLRAFNEVGKSDHAESKKDFGEEDDLGESPLMDDRLRKIIHESEDLLEDLGDVVINGEIIASKQRAYELNPVLDNIREISNRINDLSVHSIENLLHTIFSAYKENFKFYSLLAIDIMDRNLYERANDCRWWALTTTFREVLASGSVSSEERDHLHAILAYINGLYTVYTNLFLFNKEGEILAVSNSNESTIIGRKVNSNILAKLMSNRDTQNYFVSDFEKTSLYGKRHTYIYYATVLSAAESRQPVGGIGIVFDSEPEFKAMLDDSLPRNDQGEPLMNSFALIVDPERNIISSTSPDYPVGSILEWDESVIKTGSDGIFSGMIEHGEERYLVGCRRSGGYREYKCEDNYTNELFAIIAAKI